MDSIGKTWTCSMRGRVYQAEECFSPGMMSVEVIKQSYALLFVGHLLSRVPLCDPWTAARQASLPFTISWSLPKLMSIESVMPSNLLVLCRPLLFLLSVFPSIRVFSSELAFHIRWTKY